jgi:hypothetical protein
VSLEVATIVGTANLDAGHITASFRGDQGKVLMEFQRAVGHPINHPAKLDQTPFAGKLSNSTDKTEDQQVALPDQSPRPKTSLLVFLYSIFSSPSTLPRRGQSEL